jgi:hypothetical protein
MCRRQRRINLKPVGRLHLGFQKGEPQFPCTHTLQMSTTLAPVLPRLLAKVASHLSLGSPNININAQYLRLSVSKHLLSRLSTLLNHLQTAPNPRPLEKGCSSLYPLLYNKNLIRTGRHGTTRMIGQIGWVRMTGLVRDLNIRRMG